MQAAGGPRMAGKAVTRLAQYNPQSATGTRVDDISEELSHQHCVGLIGTMRRSTGDMMERYQKTRHHIALHWGWHRAENVNRSCGVSLLLCKKRYSIKHIRKVFPIPKTLWGRLGAVLIEAGQERWCFIVAYFPPKPSGAAKELPHSRTVARMCACISGILGSTPARYVPALFMDATAGFQRLPPTVGRYFHGEDSGSRRRS